MSIFVAQCNRFGMLVITNNKFLLKTFRFLEKYFIMTWNFLGGTFKSGGCVTFILGAEMIFEKPKYSNQKFLIPYPTKNIVLSFNLLSFHFSFVC